MDKLQMAKALLVTEENAYTKGGQTVTAYGIAVSDSVDGLVRINLGGDTVSPEDDQAIEVETTFSVKEGDEVIVSLIGADGTGKTPIVIGVIGRMDELERDISRNYSLVLNEEYSGTDCTITALIYHYSDDITDDYEPRQFVWYKKTEDGKTALGTGKSITVSIEDMGYGGVIRCEFSSYLEGGYLTTYDGRVITLFDDTPIVVADIGDITLDFNLAQEIAVYDSENRPIAGIDKAANEAYSMAELTPQHFFHNSQGAFVTSDDVKCDTFTGDGIVTGFTLSGSPYNNSLLALYVAGASVTSGYSVSGNVLTFDSAPTGSIVALWVASEMQDYAKMDSDSFDIVKATDTVASFGREVTVGTRLSGSTVGNYSQVYGNNCTASGNYSHAEGFQTKATGAYSHAEGDQTEASGQQAHAEGNAAIAEGIHAHAEGLGTKASGYHSHAEGVMTLASGFGSHAEGNGDGTNLQYGTQATGRGSHAEGMGTLAKSDAQHVQGKYNIEDTSGLYAEIVGNGSAVIDPITHIRTVTRSNARTLDWAGNEKLSGEIDAYVRTATVAGYAGNLHLYRFGRVVFVSTDDFKPKSGSVASETVLTQVIPVGFRPISVAFAPRLAASSTNNNFLLFGSDGSITYKGGSSWTNATTWSGTWITGDD